MTLTMFCTLAYINNGNVTFIKLETNDVNTNEVMALLFVAL